MRRIACLLLIASAGCIGLPKYVEPAVPEPVEESVDSLALAADCLDRGDSTAAIPHLADHIRKYPEQVMIRSLLAEQLLKLGKYNAARIEFERTAEEYRTDLAKHRESLIQCHTRLMQIAQERGDEFAEPFHRGAGLLLVVESWDKKDRDANLNERTLSQALTNLREAIEKQPQDARANFMLGEVLSRLGQHAAARSAFLKAKSAWPGNFTNEEWNQIVEQSR